MFPMVYQWKHYVEASDDGSSTNAKSDREDALNFSEVLRYRWCMEMYNWYGQAYRGGKTRRKTIIGERRKDQDYHWSTESWHKNWFWRKIPNLFEILKLMTAIKMCCLWGEETKSLWCTMAFCLSTIRMWGSWQPKYKSRFDRGASS